MTNNVKRRNLSNSLTSGKSLKAMLGEEEEFLDENDIEEEAELDLDDEDDADDYDNVNDSEIEDADNNAGDKDDIDSDDDAEEEQSSEDDWDAEEDDLLVLKHNKRKAKLNEDEYKARIGKITAEKKKGDNGEPWVKVTLPFEVKTASGVVTVPFRASMSLSPKGRLYPIVKGILGRAPEEGLNLRELQGKQVKVKIGHYVDDRGSVWEEVKSVRRVG